MTSGVYARVLYLLLQEHTIYFFLFFVHLKTFVRSGSWTLGAIIVVILLNELDALWQSSIICLAGPLNKTKVDFFSSKGKKRKLLVLFHNGSKLNIITNWRLVDICRSRLKSARKQKAVLNVNFSYSQVNLSVY